MLITPSHTTSGGVLIHDILIKEQPAPAPKRRCGNRAWVERDRASPGSQRLATISNGQTVEVYRFRQSHRSIVVIEFRLLRTIFELSQFSLQILIKCSPDLGNTPIQ